LEARYSVNLLTRCHVSVGVARLPHLDDGGDVDGFMTSSR